MKCDVKGCNRTAIVIENCVYYCLDHAVKKWKGEKLELNPLDWKQGVSRLQ
jgi:hypothetical protein